MKITYYSLPMLPVFTESETDGLYCLRHDVEPEITRLEKRVKELEGALTAINRALITDANIGEAYGICCKALAGKGSRK